MEEGIIIILFIILIIIMLIAYIVYKVGAFWNGFPITSCGKYAGTRGTVGTANGPKCAPGSQLYGGVCYKDSWSGQGGKKTAICTVDFGRYEGVKTKCGVGVYYLNYGDPCPMFGEGYRKTAVCTCQKGGVVTSSQFCKSTGIPKTCAGGWDYYGSICYKEACPEGYYRSAICTCAKKF